MRNLILAMLATLLIVLAGCGGGGSPATPDLAGLEGTWDYNQVFSGDLSGPGGSIPVNDNYSGFFIIGRNSVVDEDGIHYVWSYNGTTLVLKDAYSDTDWDVDCGDEYFSGNMELRIPLSPSSTVGNMGGTAELTLLTEFCGDYSGTVQITGNMTKR